jgi:four helix bundle protein
MLGVCFRVEATSIERLKVWQKSMDLAVASYRISSGLPDSEKFGLISQIRRAATSVPANIAEGFGRWNGKEFARFLSMPSGSLRELYTHFIIARRLNYLEAESLQPLIQQIDEISAMLYSLRAKLKAKEKTSRRATGT